MSSPTAESAPPSLIADKRPAVESPPAGLLPVLAACGIVVALVQTMIVPLLPVLPRLTNSSPGEVSWLLTTTLLTGAIATPLIGRMGDMYGKKRMLTITLAVLATGSLVCAVSSNIGVLILGRGLQGAALAVIPLGISILRDVLPPLKVVGAVALMSSTLGVGSAIGLPVAALITQSAGWHTMFWACAVFAAAALICVRFLVPESTVRTEGHFDFLGAGGLAIMLTSLMLAVTKGGDWGWGSLPTLGLLATSIVVGAVWTRYELRSPAPMVDLRVSVRPAVLLTNIAAFFIGFAFYANSLTTAQLVQEPTSTGYGLGATMLVSSLCLLPGGICMALFSPVSARLSRRHGAKFSLATASAVLFCGYVVRIFTSHSLIMIILGATVVSVGTALAYSALPTLIMGSVPITETGAANGLSTLVRTVGQSVCAAVAVLVLSHVTVASGGVVTASLNAYLVIFGIAALVSLGALAAALLIPSVRPAAGGRHSSGLGRVKRAKAPIPVFRPSAANV